MEEDKYAIVAEQTAGATELFKTLQDIKTLIKPGDASQLALVGTAFKSKELKKLNRSLTGVVTALKCMRSKVERAGKVCFLAANCLLLIAGCLFAVCRVLHFAI